MSASYKCGACGLAAHWSGGLPSYDAERLQAFAEQHAKLCPGFPPAAAVAAAGDAPAGKDTPDGG